MLKIHLNSGPIFQCQGGDLFAIVYDPKSKKHYGYNGSGRSPRGRDLAKLKAEIKAAHQRAGETNRMHIPPFGSLPVTVPGAVDAWLALHQRFGKLPMKEDLQPAIDYARNGFPVTQLIARYSKLNGRRQKASRLD